MSESIETEAVIDNLTKSSTINVTSENQDGKPAGLTIVTEASEEDTATTITEPYITKK